MLAFGVLISICASGFNFAIQYISNLVFSSVTLVDPAVTGLIAWIAGLEGIPDLYTMLVGGVVVGGVLLITMGESKEENNDCPHANVNAVDDDSAEKDSNYRMVASATDDPPGFEDDLVADLEAGTSVDSNLLEVEMIKMPLQDNRNVDDYSRSKEVTRLGSAISSVANLMAASAKSPRLEGSQGWNAVGYSPLSTLSSSSEIGTSIATNNFDVEPVVAITPVI